MRFPHWLKSLASALVLTATAGPVLAQGPGGPGAGQPMFQPAYGANDPGVLYPQGVPQGYNPYPAISPYGMGNVAWDQTFRDDNGLWFERIMNTNREYFGSIDVTYNRIKNAGDKELGSPHIPLDPISNGLAGFNIPTFGQGATPGGAGGGVAAGAPLPLSRIIVDRRVIPYPLSTGLPVLTAAQINNAIFPIRGLSEFDNADSAGIQGGWGFFNEDGSGMAVNGFWSGAQRQDFTMGQDSINGVPITQAILLASDGTLLFTRNGAIPLDWGFSTSVLFPNLTGNLGTTKYDLLFHMDTKTSVVGTDLNFYYPPVIRNEGFQLRPLIGGRYMFIDEDFNFRGIDSGFSYGLTIVAGGGAAAAGNTFRPTAGSLTAEYALYEATLNSTVRSHLAGPQVGIRYDFGNNGPLKITGQTIVGLMGNQEQFSLSGNNIGDQQGLLLFGGGLDMLAADARFASRHTTSHVSPLFEQGLNAEMKILERIPGIRRLPGIEDTVFRVGWTATVVGEVARAGNSIDWRGFPGTPSINSSRSTWWTTKWNFGIEKRF